MNAPSRSDLLIARIETRRRRPPGRPRKLHAFPCDYCQSPMEMEPSRYRQRKASSKSGKVTCSHECGLRARNYRPKEDPEEAPKRRDPEDWSWLKVVSEQREKRRREERAKAGGGE